MPSYEPAPYRRWDPKPWWAQPVFHPPTPGTSYTARLFESGTPFDAWYSHSGEWFLVLPDANGDGTRELGARIRETGHLYYLRRF